MLNARSNYEQCSNGIENWGTIEVTKDDFVFVISPKRNPMEYEMFVGGCPGILADYLEETTPSVMFHEYLEGTDPEMPLCSELYASYRFDELLDLLVAALREEQLRLETV